VAPGELLTIFGSGLADREFRFQPEQTGSIPREVEGTRFLVEGSGYQQVLYAGAVRGELPGLMQVNVRIAPDLVFYGRLTLTIMVGGRQSSSLFWEQKP
jgi:hypothetical protein